MQKAVRVHPVVTSMVSESPLRVKKVRILDDRETEMLQGCHFPSISTTKINLSEVENVNIDSLDALRCHLEDAQSPIYSINSGEKNSSSLIQMNSGDEEITFDNALGIAMPAALLRFNTIEPPVVEQSECPQIQIDDQQQLSRPPERQSIRPEDPTLLSLEEKSVGCNFPPIPSLLPPVPNVDA